MEGLTLYIFFQYFVRHGLTSSGKASKGSKGKRPRTQCFVDYKGLYHLSQNGWPVILSEVQMRTKYLEKLRFFAKLVHQDSLSWNNVNCVQSKMKTKRPLSWPADSSLLSEVKVAKLAITCEDMLKLARLQSLKVYIQQHYPKKKRYRHLTLCWIWMPDEWPMVNRRNSCVISFILIVLSLLQYLNQSSVFLVREPKLTSPVVFY